MAKVVITIQDGDEEGDVDVNLSFDPPLDTTGSEEHEDTPAQSFAAELIGFLPQIGKPNLDVMPQFKEKE